MSTGAWPLQLLSRIEDAGLNASAPSQQRWVDGWLVRFSAGKAKRARCINAVAAGLLPFDEKLALCQAFYDQCGLRMLMRVTPFSCPADLDDRLARRGFERLDETSVMVGTTFIDTGIQLAPIPLRCEAVSVKAFAHIVGELRGTPMAGRLAHADRLMHCPVPLRPAVLRTDDGAVQACALSAIESDIVGLYDVFTAAAARGLGSASWLCARLLGEARAQGARVAYLQVDAGNQAAASIYRRLGFADAYRYHYRALPGAAG